MAGEALVQTGQLSQDQRRETRRRQVRVDATKDLQISSHLKQSFTGMPGPRSIHDRHHTAVKLPPTFMPRSAARGHARSSRSGGFPASSHRHAGNAARAGPAPAADRVLKASGAGAGAGQHARHR
jgi:hypothetical protein